MTADGTHRSRTKRRWRSLLGGVGVSSLVLLGSACEVDDAKKKRAEAKLQEAQDKIEQARDAAREKIDEARPEVEEAMGELQEGAQRGYDRAKSNVEEAASYSPIEGANDAIDCDSDGNVCTVDAAFVQQFAAHPEWLARELKISPAFRGGRVHGLRIAYVPKGSLLDLVNLRAGDVVTEVDGKSVTSIADLQSLAKAGGTTRAVEVVYLRGGEPKKLTLRQRK